MHLNAHPSELQQHEMSEAEVKSRKTGEPVFHKDVEQNKVEFVLPASCPSCPIANVNDTMAEAVVKAPRKTWYPLSLEVDRC